MIKKYKKFFAVYFAWVCFLLVVLMQTRYGRGLSQSFAEMFWPFSKYGNLENSFDISEFLAYSLAPLILFGISLAFKEKE